MANLLYIQDSPLSNCNGATYRIKPGNEKKPHLRLKMGGMHARLKYVYQMEFKYFVFGILISKQPDLT